MSDNHQIKISTCKKCDCVFTHKSTNEHELCVDCMSPEYWSTKDNYEYMVRTLESTLYDSGGKCILCNSREQDDYLRPQFGLDSFNTSSWARLVPRLNHNCVCRYVNRRVF